MTKNDISVVIFSKNRSLQLEANISSFIKYCENKDLLFDDNTDMKITVIYKADELYKNSYRQLISNYYFIDFVEETDFKLDLLSAISNRKFTMFICDDTIFVRKFNLKEIIGMLDDEKDIYSGGTLGFSFRLGENTTNCYSLNRAQNVPEFIVKNNRYIIFDWTNAENDFGYALEVSSSLYKTNIVLGIIQNCSTKNPNDFEWSLFQQLRRFDNFLPYLISGKLSYAFSVPANKVQDINSNRFSNNEDYTPEKMLDVFNSGKWINIDKFDGFISNGCHQEVDLEFIEYGK